jgi:hypothetical protein
MTTQDFGPTRQRFEVSGRRFNGDTVFRLALLAATIGTVAVIA